MNNRLILLGLSSLILISALLCLLFNESYSKNSILFIFAFACLSSVLAFFEMRQNYKETDALRSELKNCTDKLSYSQLELQHVLNFLDSGVVKIIFDGELKRHIQWANDGFYNLTGYGKAGYDADMDDNPHKVLHPDDMEWVFEAFKTHVQRRDSLTLEYRVFHKDGHVVWLYVKSNFVGEQDGFPVFISIMLDITEQKLMREEVFMNQKRYEFINSISKELLFEYNVTKDLMNTFNAQIETFGQNKNIQNFKAAIPHLSFIHSEDRDVVAKLFSTTSEDSKPVNSPRFRMATANGDYEWYYACYATIHVGSETIMLGKLVNIHQSTELITQLEHLSATDSMTGLFNKTAFEQRALHSIDAESDKTHALMVLDIDNFKYVNDSFGHQYGDMVIAGIVRTLRETFRGNDIIGRVGGDEFSILLCDVHDEKHVSEIVQDYLDQLKELRIEPHMDKVFSTSIGIAMYPACATAYQDLFGAADFALYGVKNRVKGGFAFAPSPAKTADCTQHATV